jgi:serine/threonine-protein kinase ATR
MSAKDQCDAMNLLAYLPCAADNTLNFVQDKTTSSIHLQCSFCSQNDVGSSRPSCLDESVKKVAVECFTKLVRLPSFLESQRPRVVALVSLRRMIKHFPDRDLWDLERSGLGQWSLQSLQSSIRELRIAAGRAVAELLKDPRDTGVTEDIIQRNRGNALSILKSLSDKDAPHLSETCIMAWGQIGRVVPLEELNLVLIKLTEYLGHRNTTVSAFSFNEILNLAEARGTTTMRLFEPFWKNLAFLVVKDMVSRPQTTRMVAELFQIRVTDLLCRLQVHALPWLVLTKKKEVIQRITEARGEAEIWRPCLETANLAHILSLLLVQEVPDVETYVMALFKHVSPHFETFSLVDLLKVDPLPTALELLKLSGSGDEVRRSRVRFRIFSLQTNWC